MKSFTFSGGLDDVKCSAFGQEDPRKLTQITVSTSISVDPVHEFCTPSIARVFCIICASVAACARAAHTSLCLCSSIALGLQCLLKPSLSDHEVTQCLLNVGLLALFFCMCHTASW
eukprot:3511946-Amphidinium_carterae.1